MLRLAIVILALLLLLLPPGGGEAFAQEANVMNWRATLPVQRAAPAQPRRTYQPRLRSSAPVAPVPLLSADDPAFVGPMPETPPAPPVVPEEQRRRIALIGDSFAEALSYGFEADAAFSGEIVIRSRLVSAAGLVRDDYHDWPKALGELLSANKDVAAIVIMLGLNDRQVMRIGSEALEPLSDAWRAAYRQRIDALLGVARTANIPVIWVGMPVVRLPKFSADLMQINEMLRERVQLAGQTWLDMADAFADGNGGFNPMGPDIIGDIVRLRGPDGIHFTPAGQRKLAFFVERPLRRILGESTNTQPAITPPQGTPIVPVPTPAPAPDASAPNLAAVTTQPAPQAPGLNELAIPLPQIDGIVIPMPRPRPAIGETRQLNEVRSAPRLVGRGEQGFADEANRQFFERGLAPRPQAGRSDDYTWR